MKLVALYKTWDGGEFVDASLASIYDSVSSVVMVHSETSWLGERGNTVRPDAVRWCEQYDRESKVHHVDVELTNQEAQYQAGIEYIRRHRLPCDVVFAIDADEVWEPQYIENAVRQISDKKSPAYRSNMHTYLKNPFFRVAPPYGSPTVFFREPRYLTESPRGCHAPAMQLSDVWMHHYTYVRENRSDVERKLKQSCLADGNETIVPNWMTDIYDNMPAGERLHAFQRWRHVWQRIEKVFLPEVPPAMRSARLFKLWFPEGQLSDGEMAALHRLARGRKQAVDLGTYCGLSASILALACDRVHTVDAYDQIHDTFADTLDPDRYKKMTGHSLQRTQDLAGRYGNMTAESNQTNFSGMNWSGGPVDFLFDDADHSELGVLSDFFSWIPHLSNGARIAFHDYNDIHPGVQSAVEYLRQDHRLKFISPGDFAGSLVVAEVQK